MVCRCCGAVNALERDPRRGFFQLKIFPLFGLFPWECKFCRKTRLYRAESTAAMSREADKTRTL
jgi:hypothetical protein